MGTDLAMTLGTRETANLEFKREGRDHNAIREAICALANDLPGMGGGHLIIGVDKSGKPVREIDTSDQALLGLTSIQDEGRILDRPFSDVIMQPTMRLERPVKAYQRWLDRIPQVFASDVLDEPPANINLKSYEIATLRNYQSLMPLSHDARKPMFDLRAADGVLGSTQTLVSRCHRDFRSLAEELLQRLESVPLEA